MPIFQDRNGMAIKFFIQKDIPQDIQADVCDTIAALGGRVEAKVPRAGYVLVQPGTAEEERLRLCWNIPERPERFFVPYTYIEACKIHGMLLKQIFVHDGKPIRMHIDSSIANINVRATLSARIMHSGGDPTASAQSARVILADPNTEVFQHLVKTYQGEVDKYVESYLWVKKCIEKGQVIYTPVVYKNPGGRRPGEERTQFTEDDEERLCQWIAAKIPYKETGGRTGNRLYQQLVDMGSDPEFGWTSRHTWQSWRERYKKNAARLDVRITEIVRERQPALGEKGQYGYVRMPEVLPKRLRGKKSYANNASASGSNLAACSSDQLETIEGEGLDPFAPIPVPVVAGVLQPVSGPGDPYNAMMYPGPPPPPMRHYPPNMMPPLPQAPSTSSSDTLDIGMIENVRHNAVAEELEDEESEWQIREGAPDAPQPAWAKRKGSEEEEAPSKKRKRTASRSLSQETESKPADMHVVDSIVYNIAQEFRFTVEEVKEYYDKCGDADRTRSRFRRMREALTALEEDDADSS